MAKKTSEHSHMGAARAAARAATAIELELRRLLQIDFSAGWPRGDEWRKLTKFRPSRILENLSLIHGPHHWIHQKPLVRALHQLVDLYGRANPPEAELLRVVNVVRANVDRFSADIGRVVGPTNAYLRLVDRTNRPPRHAHRHRTIVATAAPPNWSMPTPSWPPESFPQFSPSRWKN
jgi:hypothetical protein